MSFNKALALVVVLAFVAILGVVLLRQSAPPLPGDPAATSSARAGGSAPARSDQGRLELLLSSSNAKQTFIDRAVADFNARQVEVGGKVVTVKAVHANSGDSWNELREGRLKPDLWSPGDESWFRIANDAWRGLQNRPLFEKSEPLVNVPLCIAMWEPMAVALGYPGPLGWADLARVSADPRGWARYGHPEWGTFKWGHAHPDANSGFLTVVAEVYAHTRKTRGLTVADLKDPALVASMQVAEHSVEHYGLSSVWIDTFMREKGPAYLSAAVQYENAIIEGNRRTGNQPFKVVAIYPKEGTFLTQHPIGIPQAEWVTEERRAAAQRFIDYLLEPKTQALALSLGLRPILSSVPVGEPFTQEWGVSAQLPPIPSFEVPGEAILARVTDLWLEAKKPASVMLLIDTSGSMNGEAMNRAKEGAAAFIERMHGRDELEVRTFNNNITRLVPAGPVASIGEAARQKVGGLFASGGTHLYEVVKGAALDWAERKQKSPGRHYGIVVMTDGQDEGSPISRADLMEVLPKGDNPETIKIFTIAYGAKADKLFLKELSNRSNARTFESTASNIGRVYQELSANF
jgi:Ca-activated chloride channel family protein